MAEKHLNFSRQAEAVITTYLHDHFSPQEADQLYDTLDHTYHEFLKTLPNLGGRKNKQAGSVYDCISLFALYEVLPEKPTLEIFEHMVNQLFVEPYQRLSFADLHTYGSCRSSLQRASDCFWKDD